MTYSWLTAEEIISINPVLAFRGWAQLNTETARVLGAYDDDRKLVEIMAIQLYPLLGPLLRLDGTDAGETTRELATRMEAYLIENDVRGVLAVADNPVSERLCKRMEMTKVLNPVYSTVAPGQRRITH